MEINPDEEENLNFEGILAPYWENMSYEEIELILQAAKQKWLEKLLRQIEGDFNETPEEANE